VEVVEALELLTRPLGIDNLRLEIEFLDQRGLEMLVELAEVDSLKVVPLAQPVSSIDQLSDHK
jgi:hypothetical protein